MHVDICRQNNGTHVCDCLSVQMTALRLQRARLQKKLQDAEDAYGDYMRDQFDMTAEMLADSIKRVKARPPKDERAKLIHELHNKLMAKEKEIQSRLTGKKFAPGTLPVSQFLSTAGTPSPPTHTLSSVYLVFKPSRYAKMIN